MNPKAAICFIYLLYMWGNREAFLTADCRYGKMYPLIFGAGGEPFFGLGLSVGTEKRNADCIVNEGKEYQIGGNDLGSVTVVTAETD